MKKRLFAGLALLAISVFLGVMFTWWRSGIYYYQGRSLTTWSLEVSRQDPKATAALREMGSNAVPGLIELLETKDVSWRKRVWALQPRLPLRLRQLVWQKVPLPDAAGVRKAAATSLGIIGPEAKVAVPALTKALHDKELLVRSEAATALGRIGKGAVPGLIEALQDKDSEVRYDAAYALGQIGADAEAAVSALIFTLKDTSEPVRSAAAASLATIGTPGLSTLVEVLEHGDPKSREAAIKVLHQFQLALRTVVPALATLSQHPDPVERRQAIETISAIRRTDGLPINALISALKDTDAEVRVAAIKILGRAGSRAQAAAPGLRECLEDGEVSVRAAAKESLVKIGTGNH